MTSKIIPLAVRLAQKNIKTSTLFDSVMSLQNPSISHESLEGINSTRVQLVWNFTAASGSSFLITIKIRSSRDPGSQPTQIAARSDSSSAFNGVPPDYEANLPATLVIKNVTRNDEYTYTVGVLNIDSV